MPVTKCRAKTWGLGLLLGVTVQKIDGEGGLDSRQSAVLVV